MQNLRCIIVSGQLQSFLKLQLLGQMLPAGCGPIKDFCFILSCLGFKIICYITKHVEMSQFSNIKDYRSNDTRYQMYGMHLSLMHGIDITVHEQKLCIIIPY
jgi:hypothetical protein